MFNKQVIIISVTLQILVIFEMKTNAAKILAYFPTPSFSHQIAFRPLINELVKRGHDVTVITPDPQYPKGKSPANLMEVDVHETSYKIFNKKFLNNVFSENGSHSAAILFCDALFDVFDYHMQDVAVRKAALDRSLKYDLLILEAWFSLNMYLTHVHKVPSILISSFGSTAHNLDIVGASLHVSRQPLSWQKTIATENIWQKICSIFSCVTTNVVQKYIIEQGYKRLKKVDPTTPTIYELANNVDMLFVNLHPIWDLNRPVPPNVIYLGGIHVNQPKELPPNLKSYMDSSKNGVIYISFGTNVIPSLLPSNVLHSLVKVCSKLPYDVIWRWSKDELPGRGPNIKLSKWLPQEDLLRHPKVKLFITQGGLQSTEEAINGGVPMIAIPVHADQWYNADLYVRYKIGLRLDLLQVDEDNLVSAINNILGNDSYRDNVVKLRSIMRDEMHSPLERAVWWTEYVIRHGGAKHLRSPLANLTWAEYLELDVVFLILGISLTTTICLVIMTCKFIGRCKNKTKPNKKQQ